MVESPVLFPREYRPVAGGALAVVVFAWVAVIGSAVFVFGAQGLQRWTDAQGSGSRVVVANLTIGGVLTFLVAWVVMGLCFVFWRGRVRSNAKLAVGPNWSGRRRPLSLNDVWNASDPAQRAKARADRPKNPAFAVWLLSYFGIAVTMGSYWYVGRRTTGMGVIADMASVLAVVTVVFAVAATLSVRAITRRQNDPAMFTPAQV